ncbi:MAG: SNF2-related protein [Bacilli bacterium]
MNGPSGFLSTIASAMIADEMGLGKTLQTLSIIDYYLRSKSSGEKSSSSFAPQA